MKPAQGLGRRRALLIGGKRDHRMIGADQTLEDFAIGHDVAGIGMIGAEGDGGDRELRRHGAVRIVDPHTHFGRDQG